MMQSSLSQLNVRRRAKARNVAPRGERLLRSGTLGGSRPGDPLTRRESQVAQLVASGLSNICIAEKLKLSPGTVHVYVGVVMRKLGVHTRYEIGQKVAAFHDDRPEAVTVRSGAD